MSNHKLVWLEDAPFFQAGLQGYSDGAMRIVARRHGAPFCVTESLLDQVLIRGGKGLEAAALEPEDHPIAGQIIGTEPADMARAARVLLALGHDVIDVNLACPVKKMRGVCRGGHMLSRPDLAADVLKAVRDAVGDSAPVTVKLRRGYDESAESLASFYRVLESVIDLGYHAATVHARTVEEKYGGEARWPFLADLTCRYPQFTILGSGDVLSARSIFRMIEETGVRGVSVARGAIGNPWIFHQARQILRGEPPTPPTVAEQRRVLEEHRALATRLHGERRAGPMLRKLGIKLSVHHPLAGEVGRAFISAVNDAAWRAVVEEFYSAGEARLPARAPSNW
ncbi:MAG TPA: tRNA-dihydrouridine synthase family protein [Planctomycetota bacterium]|nr:tRNA-dihydrouridine synthase family protein [Planctomycetota bacterium]